MQENSVASAGTGGVGHGFIEPLDYLTIMGFGIINLKALPADKSHNTSGEINIESVVREI